jgi:hypothetical protein
MRLVSFFVLSFLMVQLGLAQLQVKGNEGDVVMTVDENGNALITGKTTTQLFQMTGTNPGFGKILLSDAQGNASWNNANMITWTYYALGTNMVLDTDITHNSSDWELIFLPFSDFDANVIPDNATMVEVNMGCSLIDFADSDYFQVNILKLPTVQDVSHHQHGSLHCSRSTDGFTSANSGNFSLTPIMDNNGEKGIYIAHRFNTGFISIKIMGYHIPPQLAAIE